MKKTAKLMVVAFIMVLVIGFTVGCEKKVKPYTVDFYKAIIGVPTEFDLAGDPSAFGRGDGSPVVPWTFTECTNLKSLPPGIEKCGNCPTCEGKTTVVMNEEPMLRQWKDFPIYFPPFPEDFDWSVYNKVRIRVRCYYEDFEEFFPSNGKAMVSMIYDTTKKDIRGPSAGPGPNTPMKYFNLTRVIRPEEGLTEDELPVSALPGGISSDEGVFLFLDRTPDMILFQSADQEVAYIEIVEVTFWGEKIKSKVKL